MIEIDSVTKRFGRATAVDGLNLTTQPGELFAFLGPNGAGKTTTIKMLTGLLRPSEGTIRIGGHDVVTERRQATLISGYVPDQPLLYDQLSGRELLEFVTGMYGMEDANARREIERRIEQFELGEFVDRVAKSYSHGMKQRVAFAAALAPRPKLLVVDEPMVGLDPRSIRLVKDLLRQEVAAGLTVFMSTHTLAVAEEIADSIGIIDRGRLSFRGTVEELRQRLSDHETTLEQLFLRLTEEEVTTDY